MKTVEDVNWAREQLGFEIDALLRRRGWKHSSSNPACLWLWEKALPDGRIVLVNTDTALRFLQVEINDACICTEEDTEDHRATCPAKGDS